MKTPHATTADGQQISPPQGLVKAEKTEFFRVVRLRNAMDRPLYEREIDLAADYAITRCRISRLRRLARRKARESPDDLGEILACDRAVAAAIGAARRLSRELGLTR
jgi:hypothetical protein